MQPLAIIGSGMVTGVGLNAPATCAAIRCAIDNFQETRFMDAGGEWMLGCEVPLEQPWRGTTKLVKMLVMALRECLACEPGLHLENIPVLICLAETERPGRLQNLESEVFYGAQQELGLRFHEHSGVIVQGRVSAVAALKHAHKWIYEQRGDKLIIAGVDSLLVAPTLATYEEREQLLTSQNSNGFIPGEAAAAILIEAAKTGETQPQLVCSGIGFGMEKATEDSGLPLRADGLVQAIKMALADAGCDLGDLDYRITDISGGQYGFKEAALALSRILRKRKEEFDISHPADCIGEVGAAAGPVILAVTLTAMDKGYTPGRNALCHFGSEEGKRAAAVLNYRTGGVI